MVTGDTEMPGNTDSVENDDKIVADCAAGEAGRQFAHHGPGGGGLSDVFA